MATIYNSQLSKELIDGAKIQTSKDNIPNQIADKVVPVMEVNPKLLRRINFVYGATRTTTGNYNLYTTPTDKDFYLVGLTAAYIKDVVCDSASGSYAIQITPDSSPVSVIYSFPIITLTAQTLSNIINLPMPIKLARGSGITFNGTYTAGVCERTISIFGYFVENPNA